MLPINLRWMLSRDLPEVLAIEQASFEFPWTRDDFVRDLRQRDCIGHVAELEVRGLATSHQFGPIVGFMVYKLHRNRIQILNFAVHPGHRRCGIGTALVRRLAGKLHPERRRRIELEVRERNLPAQQFFRQMGFKALSVLKDFYRDTDEDAYLFRLRHGEFAEAADLPLGGGLTARIAN